MQTFKEKYVDNETAFARKEMNEELEDWVCQVHFATASVKLVCCPEDKVCSKRCASELLCAHCWVPVCRSCKIDMVAHGKQPAAALSNDMMCKSMLDDYDLFQFGAKIAGGSCLGSGCMDESAAYGHAWQRNYVSISMGRFATAIASIGSEIGS